MSSPPSTPSPTRTRRTSRFIEGEPLTYPDLLSQPSSSNEFLVTILSEMDALERKRMREKSNSNTSLESVSTPSSSSSTASSPIVGKPELQRSFGVARASLDDGGDGGRKGLGARPSLDERSRPQAEEKLSTKIKGRLRAWTGGRDGKMAAYSGS